MGKTNPPTLGVVPDKAILVWRIQMYNIVLHTLYRIILYNT